MAGKPCDVHSVAACKQSLIGVYLGFSRPGLIKVPKHVEAFFYGDITVIAGKPAASWSSSFEADDFPCYAAESSNTGGIRSRTGRSPDMKGPRESNRSCSSMRQHLSGTSYWLARPWGSPLSADPQGYQWVIGNSQ